MCVCVFFASNTYFCHGLKVSRSNRFTLSHCSPSSARELQTENETKPDILLDFDKNDPLLMVGRMCLAVTITLAFPMLVIPGRDIVVRSLILPRLAVVSPAPVVTSLRDNGVGPGNLDVDLREPLLEAEICHEEIPSTEVDSGPFIIGSTDSTSSNGGDSGDGDSDSLSSVSFTVLLFTSVILFWSAAALASLVSSIDVVWDLLGSSLSILMSYLIPAGTYLVITKRIEPDDEAQGGSHNKASRLACWLLLGVSVPLMVVSTANAVYNTFF
jgi:hypothetical protein